MVQLVECRRGGAVWNATASVAEEGSLTPTEKQEHGLIDLNDILTATAMSTVQQQQQQTTILRIKRRRRDEHETLDALGGCSVSQF